MTNEDNFFDVESIIDFELKTESNIDEDVEQKNIALLEKVYTEEYKDFFNKENQQEFK